MRKDDHCQLDLQHPLVPAAAAESNGGFIFRIQIRILVFFCGIVCSHALLRSIAFLELGNIFSVPSRDISIVQWSENTVFFFLASEPFRTEKKTRLVLRDDGHDRHAEIAES